MITRTTHKRPFWAITALVASLFVALLFTAPGVQANTGAGATIFNTVQVDYRDASGTTSYSANATTFTTVNLLRAGLTIGGRPTSGSPGKIAACPANQTVDSGATALYLIALTANANGGDTYNLTGLPGTVTNMASNSVTWRTMRNDGTTQITPGSPATVTLGSSVVQAVNVGAGTISIPGGTLAQALIDDNTTGGKVIVVGGIDYSVTNISWGNIPSNTHVGNTYYNNLGTATTETLAVLTLAANASGSNTNPTTGLASVNRGDVVAEQILVELSYTGVVGSTAGTDGVVNWQLSTTDGGSGNLVNSCNITTTFRASNLQVQKTVRNVTKSGPFGASATGDPGDILEYQVQVNNAGGSVAKLVTGLDNVPVYTQLVCGVGALGTTVCTGTGTDIIATINDGSNTRNITYQNTDDECGTGSPTNVGAGNAAGFAENSALNFYIGNTCNASTGGNVTNGQLYTILYRVKLN